MKIVIFFLFLAILNGVLSDTPIGNNVKPKTQNNAIKRDTDDETAISRKINVQGYGSNYQMAHYMNQFAPMGHYLAAATPQVYYAKPDAGLQYSTPSGYRLAYAASQHQPQIAYAASVPSPAIKYPQSNYVPVQVAYAAPSPVQFAYSLGSDNGGGHDYGRHQTYAIAAAPGPYQNAIQIAFSPQHHGPVAYMKGNDGSSNSGFHYAAAMPQYAVYTSAPGPQISKSYSTAPQSAILAAPPSQAYHHQPTFAYSIQPSIQVASAKQILAPTMSTPEFRPTQMVKNFGHPDTSAAPSFATLSQHLVTPTTSGISGKGVVAQPGVAMYSATASTPVYSNGKFSYGPIAHPSEPTASYTNPGAIHYGTHLYHPSGVGGKITSIGVNPKYS